MKSSIGLNKWIPALILLVIALPTGAKETASAETLSYTYLPLAWVSPPPPSYLAPFDGTPAAPESYQPADWDVTVHSRDRAYWYNLEPMQAVHGDHCDAPPATHLVDSYENAVFRCNNHLMTAIRASGYGVIYLTPNQMVDFSGNLSSVGIIRFDVSTLRTSKRDWIDLWVTPYQDNLQAPLEDWLPDLNGEPRQAIHIRMDFGSGSPPGGSFEGEIIREFEAEELPQNASAGYETLFTPSATQRQTFELRISATHIQFGIPAYDFWWIDTDIADLGWSQGIVQLGHHSYNPMKDCATCSPNTWHWDNVQITPAVPFTIVRADHRYVQPGSETLQLVVPAPADSHLRFSGIGDNLEVSFDGGASWQAAQMQAQEEYHSDHFRTYWTPIPAGTTSVHFRGEEWYGGDWHARDISVWSLTAPATAPQAAAAMLTWAGFIPALLTAGPSAPEACHLPVDQQLALVVTK
jgi:hypothetical protein